MGAALNGSQDSQLAMNIFAWFSNVSTSVLIVFVNKMLMKVARMCQDG